MLRTKHGPFNMEWINRKGVCEYHIWRGEGCSSKIGVCSCEKLGCVIPSLQLLINYGYVRL